MNTAGFRRRAGSRDHLPGVNRVGDSYIPPARAYRYEPAVNVSSGTTFAVPKRGRSAHRNAEALRPYHRARRGGSFRFRPLRAASHRPGGYAPLRVETAPRRLPLLAATEQETLLDSPAGPSVQFRVIGRKNLSVSPAGPVPGVVSGLHQVRGADCPYSPTPRSELHPVRADRG